MKIKCFAVLSLSIICCMLTMHAAIAQNAMTEEELAKAAQNPVANMMSFPFQNNTNFNVGPYFFTWQYFINDNLPDGGLLYRDVNGAMLTEERGALHVLEY